MTACACCTTDERTSGATSAAELGIDIPGILKRSTCIASSRTRNLDLEGLDLGGPLMFVLLLACIHLLVSHSTKAVQQQMLVILSSHLHILLLYSSYADTLASTPVCVMSWP